MQVEFLLPIWIGFAESASFGEILPSDFNIQYIILKEIEVLSGSLLV